MPELPEVETTCRAIRPVLEGQRVADLEIRERRLRWPISRKITRELPGQIIRRVRRRAKYLLVETDAGNALIHLGMSGRLRVLPSVIPPGRHDHFDISLESGVCVRYNDPRRFGCLLWTHGDPLSHPRLVDLGPEPLEGDFDGGYLYTAGRGRKAPIKQFLMDPRTVVGVGNIYANEALFRAGIHPRRAAGRISKERMGRLADSIKTVLEDAIRQGGTTLRDFLHVDGTAGYFRQDHLVYDRAGQPCLVCRTPIRRLVLGQRSTYYCPKCQR